jgi:hypothetical protein
VSDTNNTVFKQDGHYTVSLEGLVNAATATTFMHASCNGSTAPNSIKGLSPARKAEFLELLQLRKRTTGAPFIRNDFRAQHATEEYLGGRYRPVYSNKKTTAADHIEYPGVTARKINNLKFARHLLEPTGVLIGKSTIDIYKMLQGAVSAMLSFSAHVGSHSGHLSWWNVMAAHGLLTLRSTIHLNLKSASKKYMLSRWLIHITDVFIACQLGANCTFCH